MQSNDMYILLPPLLLPSAVYRSFRFAAYVRIVFRIHKFPHCVILEPFFIAIKQICQESLALNNPR